jgi:hypothetical protein
MPPTSPRRSSRRTTARAAAVKPCFAFCPNPALPVECLALTRWAAICSAVAPHLEKAFPWQVNYFRLVTIMVSGVRIGERWRFRVGGAGCSATCLLTTRGSTSVNGNSRLGLRSTFGISENSCDTRRRRRHLCRGGWRLISPVARWAGLASCVCEIKSSQPSYAFQPRTMRLLRRSGTFPPLSDLAFGGPPAVISR